MKKIFKIASYDFKRLMINPFTIGAMIVVLIGCLILSMTYKIPTSTDYSAATLGQDTSEIMDNFESSRSEIDTKKDLDSMIVTAKAHIEAQSNNDMHDSFDNIFEAFDDLYAQVDHYNELGVSILTSDFQKVRTSANLLSEFVDEFVDTNKFDRTIFFTNEHFEALQRVNSFFSEIAQKPNATIQQRIESINQLIDGKANFNTLKNLKTEARDWSVDLDSLQTKYISPAEQKLARIYERMQTIKGYGNIEYVEDMKSLVTSYKLTCESALHGVENEILLLLNEHFDLKNLYDFSPVEREELKIQNAKISFFIQDKELYYTPYQEPLNFNMASNKVSMFDATYFIIAIIGFFDIIFGIFCAYKLFGRDRRSGQMDVILSQNVTYSQVFAGKFLAIIFATATVLAIYSLFMIFWSLIFFAKLPGVILAVFNISTVYKIHPFLFFLLKLIGIMFQVIFYAVITIFIMNLSRKFELMFAISLGVFALATILNIFCNGIFVYCLFPFIHADITSFLGGATMKTGFLVTSLYASGNFYISLVYNLVVIALLYNITNQIFKRN